MNDMKKILIIILIAAAAVTAYFVLPGLINSKNKITAAGDSKRLPKVLFVTSGIDEGAGYISEGVCVALEAFGKRGVYVRLDNRNTLLRPELLSGYDIIVLPTSIGYNDGDRKYSLTFMSDNEMDNIRQYVSSGGILIAEENIGRNMSDGTDRVDGNGELNKDNWRLAELFGIRMKEIDMIGFSIEEKDVKIWNGTIKEKNELDEWALIPSEITSDKVKVFAEWVKDNERIPAVISNEYGKGRAYLLTSTYLLHPSNAGGNSGIEQIENFYNYVLNEAFSYKKHEFEINPWPFAGTTAFCISFNPGGNDDQYGRVAGFLNRENVPAVFFIDSSLTPSQLQILVQNENISLQSGFYYREDAGKFDYSQIVQGILMNEQKFGKKFRGIRFPFGITNFWGLIFADEIGYLFDSSIGIDHLTGYQGSVIPYNIPVSQNTFYKTLNIQEISPTSSLDADYFEKIVTEPDYTEEDQRNDVFLFGKYLSDFYEFVVRPKNGIMVYQGSPEYTGYNENTLMPLKKLIDSVKSGNCWITKPEEAALYRNKLNELSVLVNESDNSLSFQISLPEKTEIKGFTLKLKTKPSVVKTNSSNSVKEFNGMYYVVCDIKNGDVINIDF